MPRVNVTPDQTRRTPRGFLARTQQIAQLPELYNSLRHNCTTELAAVANREFRDPIPWDNSVVLTGYSALYLHKLGYLGDPEVPYRRLRSAARISPLVQHLAPLPERRFSTSLRGALANNQRAALRQ